MIRPVIKDEYWEHVDAEWPIQEHFVCFVCNEMVPSYSQHIIDGAHPGIIAKNPHDYRKYIAPFYSVCRVIR